MIDHHTHDHAIAADHGVHSHSSLALTFISLAHGVNHAQSALKPLIYPYAMRELGFGYSELGFLLGAASAVGGTLQLVAGGLGRVMKRHLLLGVGNALVGLCIVLIALAQSFSQFFLGHVMARTAGAVQHPVGSSLLAYHFQQRHLGLALATHFSAGNLGTALIPLLAAMFIGFWGWRITTLLFAVPGILVGLAMCAWLTEPREVNTIEASSGTSFLHDSRLAFGNRSLRWILIATVVAAGGSGHGILSNFIPLYLSHNLGMDSFRVGLIFSLLMVGSVVGPLIGGRLVDRFHPRAVILGAYAVAALAALSIPWLGGNYFLLVPIVFVLGTASFGVSLTLQTIVAWVTDDRVRDIGFALFYTAAFMAGAFWSPIVGYLAERFGLEVAFAVMASSFALATLCLLTARLDEVPSGLAPVVEPHVHM